MDWVKLTTNYYLDAAIMRAGEAAEVLFTRALAYCGDQENGGLVPREVLLRLTPTRGLARARALVREGLWEEVPAGWRFVSWDRHQSDLRARREAGRRRQATFREREKVRNASRNAGRNDVTNADVTQREEEVEEEVDAAAAALAAADRAGPDAGDVVIEILGDKLRQHTALRALRTDKLNATQAAQIVALVEQHGDQRLVDQALAALRRDDPPRTIQAFLPGWSVMPPPGQRLALVTADPCPAPGHSGTVRHCTQCASEQKAAR